MFARHSEIVQLLLLLCIILHNCGSLPTTVLKPVTKSPTENTTIQYHPWLSCIWSFMRPCTSNNFTSVVESSQLGCQLNYSLQKTAMKKKDKITDNMQQEAANQTNINIHRNPKALERPPSNCSFSLAERFSSLACIGTILGWFPKIFIFV